MASFKLQSKSEIFLCNEGYSNPYSDAKKQIQGFACQAIASHFHTVCT
jgi:hypothetical protein